MSNYPGYPPNNQYPPPPAYYPPPQQPPPPNVTYVVNPNPHVNHCPPPAHVVYDHHHSTLGHMLGLHGHHHDHHYDHHHHGHHHGHHHHHC